MKNWKNIFISTLLVTVISSLSASTKQITNNLTLTWRPTPFAQGYKIYFGSVKRKYNSDCITNYTSPIILNAEDFASAEHPNFKIPRHLITKNCHIAITSFNTAGKESRFSRDVKIQ